MPLNSLKSSLSASLAFCQTLHVQRMQRFACYVGQHSCSLSLPKCVARHAVLQCILFVCISEPSEIIIRTRSHRSSKSSCHSDKQALAISDHAAFRGPGGTALKFTGVALQNGRSSIVGTAVCQGFLGTPGIFRFLCVITPVSALVQNAISCGCSALHIAFGQPDKASD